jgi:hypothetical protein
MASGSEGFAASGLVASETFRAVADSWFRQTSIIGGSSDSDATELAVVP